MKLTVFSGALVFLIAGSVFANPYQFRPEKHTYRDRAETPEPKTITGGVYFVGLKDGARVSRKLKVKFGVKGMSVHPAGQIIYGTGHHHLIINGKPVKKMQVVPADDRHIHYGKGQTEDTIKLKKGRNTLTLQFADGVHRSYGKDWSKTITVYAR